METCEHITNCQKCEKTICSYCVEDCSGCQLQGCVDCYKQHQRECYSCKELLCPSEIVLKDDKFTCPVCDMKNGRL